MRSEEFVRYLGVDYEKKGNYIRILCPFHQDTRPSLLIYPEIERACFCFACSECCSWAWLAHIVKGIPYSQAVAELSLDTLLPSKVKRTIKSSGPFSFCDIPKKTYAEAFTEKHEACSTEYPPQMVAWLERKGLIEVAKDLDWRWHSKAHPRFKFWGDGIVIPYRLGHQVVYERFRAWDEASQSFDKPKGPFDVGVQPYFTTFRPNSTVAIAEGESDCASLYAHGMSAIGIPGACSRKAINTAVGFVNDRSVKNGGYIDTLIVCGDKDEAGQKMNQLIREAAIAFCSGVRVEEYVPDSDNPKADINDDHAAGLLKVPVNYTCYYGDNYDRQPYANKSFAKAVCESETILDSFDDLEARIKRFEGLVEAFMTQWDNDATNKTKDIMADAQFKVYMDELNQAYAERDKLVAGEVNGCVLFNTK